MLAARHHPHTFTLLLRFYLYFAAKRISINPVCLTLNVFGYNLRLASSTMYMVLHPGQLKYQA